MILTVELALPATDPAAPQIRRVEAGQKDWKFSSQKQDGEQYYRTKMSGNFILTGADFTWLYEQWQRFPCCVDVEVNVYKPKCEPVQDGVDDELFWPGYFPLSAVRFDFYECKAEVREVKIRDGYDALYRVWDNPVDMLKASSPAGTLPKQPFVAIYPNYFTYQADPSGQMRLTLPDGNKPGTGPSSQEHEYFRGIPWFTFLTKLIIDTTYGTPAAGLASIFDSTFYTAAINPVTKRPNLTRGVMPGSDAKRPASVTPAVKMVISLRELLDELKVIHNVWHLIDPDTGRLRLEHYSWFAQSSYESSQRVSVNLLKYPEALKKGNNESVDLESLYGIEEIVIENNAGSELFEFRTGSVRYDDSCAARDEKGKLKVNTLTASRFFTDLNAAYKNPDSVPDDSIFFYELQPAKAYGSPASNLPMLASSFEIKQYQDYTTIVGLGNNGFMAASMLFIDYHRYGRSFTAGLVNAVKQADGSFAEGIRMSMYSTLPTRRQENIVIPVCCSDFPLNLRGFLKTNRFDKALLDKATFDPAADTLTLDVLATSRCQESVVIINPPDPDEDCAPRGSYVGNRTEVAYCSDGVTVMASQDFFIYTDGECGTYEEAGTISGVGGC